MDTIRKKRKRYRRKKKRVLCERKHGLTTTKEVETDSGCVSGTAGVPASDDSESFPGDHRFDDLLEEANRLRQVRCNKEMELKNKYSSYVDSVPAFKDDEKTFSIPQTVHGIDRMYIESHMNDLLKKENSTSKC